MTELLTHVLTGYVLGTVLSLRVDWLDRRFVTVVMLGSILPDLTKVSLIVPSVAVQETLGLPFYWFVLHTPFGTTITAGMTALLVAHSHQKRVFGLLLAGSASHFVLDSLLINPSRFSSVLLWPFATELVPLPMYVASSDRLPAVLAVSAAAGVWVAQRRIVRG